MINADDARKLILGTNILGKVENWIRLKQEIRLDRDHPTAEVTGG